MSVYMFPFSYWSFSRLVPYFRSFPHLLPIDVSQALPAYNYIFGDKTFYLDWVPEGPRAPRVLELVQACQFYATASDIDKKFIETQWRWYGDVWDVDTKCRFFAYIWPSAQKLLSLLTLYEPYLVAKYRTLKDVPRYSELSQRAISLLTSTTYIPIAPITDAVNTYKIAVLKSVDPGYPRLSKIGESVSIEDSTEIHNYRIQPI